MTSDTGSSTSFSTLKYCVLLKSCIFNIVPFYKMPRSIYCNIHEIKLQDTDDVFTKKFRRLHIHKTICLFFAAYSRNSQFYIFFGISGIEIFILKLLSFLYQNLHITTYIVFHKPLSILSWFGMGAAGVP